jgi:Domain of unknown function (DUF1996)
VKRILLVLTVAQAAGNVSAGTTQGAHSSLFWRIGGGVLVFVLLLAAVLLLGPLAARADAQPRIKVHCEVYATNRVDPIAHTDHLHHQIGNTSTTNSSTGTSLFNKGRTSCDRRWFTSAGWFPVERNEPVRGVNVYYRAPGNQKTIKAIPKGLQLLATEQKYSCGAPATNFSATPPYRCRDTWGTSVLFPDCINTNRLADETTNAVNSRNGVCPRTHPYRIPKISFLVSHYDGGVTKPLRVSAGVNAWERWRHMHADYFAANQPVLNNELLDLCLRNAPDRVTVADPRCGRR